MSTPVIISLGSNLGDRCWHLREAIRRLAGVLRLVRVSLIYETEGVDTPPGSTPYLNLAVLALTDKKPIELLHTMQEIERALGRRRKRRNEPRLIDLDLVLFGGQVMHTEELILPHPRYRIRNFVLAPLREFRLPWKDPVTGISINEFRGVGEVRRVGEVQGTYRGYSLPPAKPLERIGRPTDRLDFLRTG